MAILLITESVIGQKAMLHDLPEGLREASGVDFLNDTTLVCVNDGGNMAELFLLSLDGELQKRVKVLDAENVDWEDLTSDKTHLYVGDFGNNKNQRKNLCVYKISKMDIIESSEVHAKKISFSYGEQALFPPEKSELFYDAEAFTFYDGSLLIFTKTNASPWTGLSMVYKLSNTPGNYVLSKDNEVFIGSDGWWSDAITSVDVIGNEFYFLTYNRVCIMKFAENKFKLLKTIPFTGLTQKEAIAIKDKNTFFVADEKQPLIGGGNLMRFEIEE